MTTDGADRGSDLAKMREPGVIRQGAFVLIPPAVVLAIPIVWTWVIGADLQPETVAPWTSAAVSLAAVLWAITRAQVDSARRHDDLRLAEDRRRADAQDYQMRIDEERWHQQAMAAATVVGIVKQTVLPKSESTKFVVNVDIRNAGQQPVLEVSIDALWLLGEPIAPLEQYVLHPVDDPPGVPPIRQVQVLEPGESLRTRPATMAGGELTSEPPFSWVFASPRVLSGYSINPVGDVAAVFSYLDHTGQRWQRVGSERPTPLPFDDPPIPSPPEGVVCIWPADSTLTISSRPLE